MKIDKYYFWVLFFSCLPLTAIWIKTDLIHTHDGLVHLPRIAAFFKALTDFHIPVRFAGELNYGYGMPLFIFIYHTPYLISSLFLLLGLGLVVSFKLALSISFLASGISMYAFSKGLFGDVKKGLIATLFYQFATFHIIEILERGSFGEVYTYVFLPLSLFFILKLWKEKKFRYFLGGSLSTACLILSHNSISLVFFAVCCLFIFFFARNKKDLLSGGIMFILGLFLSAYYWMPAILEHTFTLGNTFMENMYKDHFPLLYHFFVPNITNSQHLQIGNIPLQIGFFQLFALFSSVYLLVRKKIKDGTTLRVLTFSLILFLSALFFMQPVSSVFWEKISLLRQFQFPWRLMAVLVFSTSLLSVSLFHFKFLKSKVVFLTFILILISSTIFYWFPQEGYDRIDEEYHWDFPLTTTYYGETDVKWSEGPAKEYPKKRVEIIAGKGTVKELNRRNHFHTLEVNAQTDVVVRDRTQYFPGWKAWVSGDEVDIQFQDPNSRGIITFPVKKGSHRIEVLFTETKIRFLADIISLGGLGMLGMSGVFWKRVKYV